MPYAQPASRDCSGSHYVSIVLAHNHFSALIYENRLLTKKILEITIQMLINRG